MSTSRIVSSLAVSMFLSGALVAPSSAAQGDPAAGKATYDKTCGMCHGPTGKGDGPTAAVLPTKPRNHTDGDYMNPLTADYLFKIIKEGGAAVGKAQFMPAWGTQLKDPDIWNVIAYIRTLAVPPYQAAAQAPAALPVAAAPASGQADKK
ncbi:MAG: cytochrome c [Deltaproteobacteria bacterium]|nr:cytochrome c [Deltaproteobacteria bacterium]